MSYYYTADIPSFCSLCLHYYYYADQRLSVPASLTNHLSHNNSPPSQLCLTYRQFIFIIVTRNILVIIIVILSNYIDNFSGFDLNCVLKCSRDFGSNQDARPPPAHPLPDAQDADITFLSLTQTGIIDAPSKIFLFCCYFPQSNYQLSSQLVFFDYLSELSTEYKDLDFFLLGDFNIPKALETDQ